MSAENKMSAMTAIATNRNTAWVDLSVEDKIERLRAAFKEKDAVIEALRKKLRATEQLLNNHRHGLNNELLVPAHDSNPYPQEIGDNRIMEALMPGREWI